MAPISAIYIAKKQRIKTDILERFHSQDLMVVVGFLGTFGRVLKVVLSDVSSVSVAGIFRGYWSDWAGVRLSLIHI